MFAITTSITEKCSSPTTPTAPHSQQYPSCYTGNGVRNPTPQPRAPRHSRWFPWYCGSLGMGGHGARPSQGQYHDPRNPVL
ncbi:hypothetical protein DPMN_047390 [Dreissena polymorpha]|uniref:Uncharacterized protein n=1 Tax=Dreissena polymorpha TaxID=45954 RepID=A0A9D4HZ37_DREPO|nr:hypothetical protein DPMN_047390 [Dreissena polymorpha]